MKPNYIYQWLAAGVLFGLMAHANENEPIRTQYELLFSKIDSVNYWTKASKNTTYTLEQRKQFLLKCYHSIKANRTDTLRTRKLTSNAYQHLKLGDTLLFKAHNAEALKLATTLKDSFAIGDAHWNYATYYVNNEAYDNAYYHFNMAQDYFEKIGQLSELAYVQYGMAFIKGRFKDYTGSEVLTFKAIEIFKKTENYKSLFSCYNHLGNLQNDISKFDKALFYFEKAIENLNKVKNNNNLRQAVLNNIGNTYLKKGDYINALQNFNALLKNKHLKASNIENYARTIDNKAYCQLLMKDTTNVANALQEALDIRMNQDRKSGVVISKIHFAHYYAYAQDTLKAIAYAKEANALAKDIRNGRDYLETLSVLAHLDKKNSAIYLKKHIDFSDSLIVIERNIQNKFTRIAYETDEYIEETQRLLQQKIWIITISSILFLVFGFSIYITDEKSKKRALLFENEQQKANEQVYLISLKQQEKIENERILERNRIAEDLHDGVLGRLFGTRLGLGFLNIEGNEKTKNDHVSFLNELQTIEKEIRDVCHKLSDNTTSSQINFSSIIHNIIESKSKLGDFTFKLDFDPAIDWQHINQITKVNLFRILQEALLNILKHASATKVTLNFWFHNKKLLMEIKDDGVSFDAKQKRKGIGIKNMKSRTEKLNGKFSIVSKHNKGTQIIIKIPI